MLKTYWHASFGNMTCLIILRELMPFRRSFLRPQGTEPEGDAAKPKAMCHDRHCFVVVCHCHDKDQCVCWVYPLSPVGCCEGICKATVFSRRELCRELSCCVLERHGACRACTFCCHCSLRLLTETGREKTRRQGQRGWQGASGANSQTAERGL